MRVVYRLLLAEGHLNRRLFRSMVMMIAALPSGWLANRREGNPAQGSDPGEQVSAAGQVGGRGTDRLIYGSDWPNSDLWAPYQTVFNLVHEYFSAKGPDVQAKFFWKNSIAAYRWVTRDQSQQQLSVV
jgi:hypothetical protein